MLFVALRTILFGVVVLVHFSFFTFVNYIIFVKTSRRFY